MPTGTMKRWNSEKGFGFIAPEDGGDDFFCHVSGLLDGEGSVQEGDKVKFKIEYDDRKGKDRAVKVESMGGGGGGGRGSRLRSRSRSAPRRSGGKGGGGKGGGGGDYEDRGGRGGGDRRDYDYDRRR